MSLSEKIKLDPSQIDWKKCDGLIPVIVQDDLDGQVLMLGYMNREALNQTLESSNVTFFSRSKQRLWTKGETSGNFLKLCSLSLDCDGDTLLALVDPVGPTCHTGDHNCFAGHSFFERRLENVIDSRLDATSKDTLPPDGQSASQPERKSYVQSLALKGLDKVAQKVGEEGVETVIAAKNADSSGNHLEFLNESADLLFHLKVLTRVLNRKTKDTIEVLRSRH